MSLITLTFALTALLYAASCAAFIAHLARGGRGGVVWASRVMALATVAHAAYLACDYFVFDHAILDDIYETLAVLSLLIAIAYLASMRSHRLTVLGAFIAPVTLLLFLGAGLRGSVPPVPDEVRSALLPVHVAVNVLGIAAFALAFAAALAYLIQEKLLRQKQVVGVFQRLPSLDVLDSLGLRLVTVGFPLFTIGLITGSFWVAQRSQSEGLSVSAGQGLALVAWLFFGSVLLARASAGWRGRRAAIGTMLGFLFAMAAVGGYLFRGI
jgi:ABC-type uncharacterized transport system permease subunit